MVDAEVVWEDEEGEKSDERVGVGVGIEVMAFESPASVEGCGGRDEGDGRL